VVQDLNADPVLPFPDASFDTAVCTVSIDYLVRPVAVCAEVARVLRPGGTFALTFSHRCFPTKAVRGWLAADDEGRAGIVATYLREAGGFDEPVAQRRPSRGDPVIAVRATRVSGGPCRRVSRPRPDRRAPRGSPRRPGRTTPATARRG
jgi:SAM-dependent methyltransferase